MSVNTINGNWDLFVPPLTAKVSAYFNKEQITYLPDSPCRVRSIVITVNRDSRHESWRIGRLTASVSTSIDRKWFPEDLPESKKMAYAKKSTSWRQAYYYADDFAMTDPIREKILHALDALEKDSGVKVDRSGLNI